MGFNHCNLGNQLSYLIRPKFHASEASGSEEEDFNIFLCILYGSNQGQPGGGSIMDPGATT